MRERRLKNEINVVPYIDVMLVLLVIFMVTAPMMTTASIDVPSVGKAAAAPIYPQTGLAERDEKGKGASFSQGAFHSDAATHQLDKALRAIVAQGIDDGSIRPCDPKMVTNAIFGGFSGIEKWPRKSEQCHEWKLRA